MKFIKVTECACEDCRGACENFPGWMTPKEAMKAIEAGYTHRLMRDWWEPSEELKNDTRIYLLCPASKGHEKRDAPEFDFFDFLLPTFHGKCCCTFLESGWCEIHRTGYFPKQKQTLTGLILK